MFNNNNNATADLGPLTSISASPPESASSRLHHAVGNRSSFDFDSIIDDEQRLSQEDSLFEKKTHYRSSMSSESLLGDDYHFESGLLPPKQFRPVYVHSISSIHSPMKEDDTMISVSSISSFFLVGYKVD
jgi:serine/arginine repetitive matrix protein 2